MNGNGTSAAQKYKHPQTYKIMIHAFVGTLARLAYCNRRLISNNMPTSD